jgi:6-phosphogluconolactonase
MSKHLLVAEDANTLAVNASNWLVERIGQSVESRGVCRIVLPGGSTPKLLYETLATLNPSSAPWHAVQFFLGDERNVPIDDPQSNYGMIKTALGSVVSQGKARLHPVNIQTEFPERAAQEYETTIRNSFNISAGTPSFDIVLLGLGDDAHTASLFPFSSGLAEHKRLVISNWVEKLKTHRITLTAPVLSAARHVAFLVSGSSKSNALSQVWHAPHNPELLPAQLICPQGEFVWMVDKAALGQTPVPADWTVAG